MILETGHWRKAAAAWHDPKRLAGWLLLFILPPFAFILAADWPQPGCNPQHTNFTPDSPAPPYKTAWVADLTPEFVRWSQPVIADGRVFVTTHQGHIYALEQSSGKRLWHFRAGDCVWSSAAAGDEKYGGAGRVFVAAFEGIVWALDAASGKELWHYDAGEPVSGSPCIAGGSVFIGTREGRLLALDAGTGGLKWERPLSWQIFTAPAWNDGRIYAVTEDLRLHCVEAASGRLLWTSEQMYGMMMRDFYPCVHKGKVIVAVAPALYGPPSIGEKPLWALPEDVTAKLWMAVPKKNPDNPHEERRNFSLLRGGAYPQEWEQAQQRVLDFYEEHPEFQTVYVFNESDGKAPYKVLHSYVNAGLNAPCVPPAVCADGTVILPLGFLPGWRNVSSRLDLERNRAVDILVELGGPGDNASFFTVAGRRVIRANVQNGYHVLDLAATQSEADTSVSILPDKGPPAVQVSVLPQEYSPPFKNWSVYECSHLLAPWPAAGRHIVGWARWGSYRSLLCAFEGQ